MCYNLTRYNFKALLYLYTHHLAQYAFIQMQATNKIINRGTLIMYTGNNTSHFEEWPLNNLQMLAHTVISVKVASGTTQQYCPSGDVALFLRFSLTKLGPLFR